MLGGRVYVAAGCGDHPANPGNSVIRYDPAGDRWEEVAPLSVGRVFCAAVGVVWSSD